METESSSNEEDEESDESELEIPEMLVPNRSRRPNAGRRMQELLNQQMDKDGGGTGEKDDFYNDVNVYGGFQEVCTNKKAKIIFIVKVGSRRGFHVTSTFIG